MRTTQTLVDEFAAAIAGPVRPAGDPIASFQTGLVHRPAVVVEPLGSSDVAAVLAVAHRRSLPLTVHATGHGLRAPADGGVLVATSRMAAVRIDPVQRLARIGAGARWPRSSLRRPRTACDRPPAAPRRWASPGTCSAGASG
ncbi:FAD binding domain-containing protein [Pseudonocardia autotrophica]|uniref:Mitomycin radical oxidase n=2 Tax=Pseudonocardia TaxID=1847 RepID=A0A1Y2N1V3_PSEAH|nr:MULTISPECIES: FAD-binding protein [Pseudonocardia]OSY41455.1 Mitomycin radical oxidase [Pseudonocardia autotrophica]TDN71412.1 FAD binding domain-containing protein [Pseudonocardia autotrophica]BBG02087.1 hypothetical protein Pdca_32960 [Pseudonocardia autotrophica]GEC24101.1 hypothetical protein PSA01_11300 [Pseudonocardia saturnea]